VKVNLVKEFRKKQVLDISPDGSKLCFDNWGDAKYPLEAVEMSTWKIIWSGSFQSRVWFAWFFSNSNALLAESRLTLGDGSNVPHLTRIDLKTGRRAEGRHLSNKPADEEFVIALSDGILLDKHMDWKSIERCSIALVEFPTLREFFRVPFVADPNKPQNASLANYRSNISNDRNIISYYYGKTLVCRRTRDLRVLWTLEIESPLRAFEIESPNQNYLAVAIADNAFREQQKKSVVAIYNGMIGTEIARFPICATDGFALSPDGSLLAVIEITNNRKRKMYFTRINVHDMKSGDIIASVEHDRIKWQRAATIKAGCRVYFTADGQYLISSGMNTKIWSLDKNQG